MPARPTRWTVLSLAGAVALALPAGASGASIPVTIKGDTVADDGQCSLREAVQAANTNTANLGCPTGNGTDTITLGTGTFALSRDGARENVNATGDLDVISGSVLTIS